MNEKQLAVVLREMNELEKKFGQYKAFKIFECISSIHKATEPFPEDVKEDAMQWVLDLSLKTK